MQCSVTVLILSYIKLPCFRFSVVNNKEGFLHNGDSIAASVAEFTQLDINNGAISYVNSGGHEGRLVLKVSDGRTVSPPAVIRISTYELEVFLMNNTGLSIAHGTSAPILRNNLSCSSNHPEQPIDIIYLIAKQPVHGSIECLRNDGKWRTVTQFTESQIQKQKIRYTHTGDTNDHMDDFSFRLSALGKTWTDELVFPIHFVTISLEVVRNAELIMNAIQESFISEGNLYTVTHPKPSPRSEIIYTVLRPPKFGGVYLSTGDLIYQRRLSMSSNFTQDDVTKGRLKYKLNYLTLSNFYDMFKFRVTSNQHEVKVGEFNIKYESPPFDGKVISQTVLVREGSKQSINSSNLRVVGSGFSRIMYSVIKSPSHGVLFVVNYKSRNIARQNATFFTNREINAGLVFYMHDDTENFRDNFSYIAITEDARPNFQVVGSLKLEIIPKNDNSPVRIDDNVFHVVQHGSRTILPQDLTYIDFDVASSPIQIKYTDIKVSSGYFSKNDDAYKKIDNFSQEDINKHAIRFVHRQGSYSSATMLITDGTLQTSGRLEIVASEPYIEVVNNTGLDVAIAGKALITNYNLSVITNVDTWKQGVIYSILEPPVHGNIMLVTGKSSQVVSIFKDKVLELRELYYQHDGTNNTKDKFKFRVETQKISTEGTVQIYVS